MRPGGGAHRPTPGVVVSSSTANLPAASGSRSPRALRARSQERVDGSYRLTRLVGRCAVEEGYARLSCQWHVQVEPERPFRMQEADRRVGYDVARDAHFFLARIDMHRHVAWRVTGGVDGGHAWRHLCSGLDSAQAGAGQFQIRLGNQRLLLGGHFAGQTLPPGRARLATKPSLTGSETSTNTIGSERVS